MRKRQYRFPRDRPVSSRASQIVSSMSVYEICWSQGQIVPDDFLSELDMITIYEIRTRAVKLMNLGRTIDQRMFYEKEVKRLLEIIKIRIQEEREKLFGR